MQYIKCSMITFNMFLFLKNLVVTVTLFNILHVTYSVYISFIWLIHLILSLQLRYVVVLIRMYSLLCFSFILLFIELLVETLCFAAYICTKNLTYNFKAKEHMHFKACSRFLLLVDSCLQFPIPFCELYIRGIAVALKVLSN